jgi:hypothetical protein
MSLAGSSKASTGLPLASSTTPKNVRLCAAVIPTALGTYSCTGANVSPSAVTYSPQLR